MVNGIQNLPAYHEHCNKCYSVSCQVPARDSVSCVVIGCFRNCGAAFHACKQKEHQLLCPNEVVPCLNVDYGCPLTMLRHKLTKHLEVCPASVICCSQEWNRWPVPEADVTFYRKVSENLHSNTDAALDVGLALRDQTQLFHSIKMKNIFPELMAVESALESFSAGVSPPMGETSSQPDCQRFAGNDRPMMEEEKLCQEEKNALAKSKAVEDVQNYSSLEKMFSGEMGGCNQTLKNMNEEGKGKERQKQELWNTQAEKKESSQEDETIVCGNTTGGATGLAPWQDGVLERLGKKVNIGEYNMYLVHHGAMLINFGQLAACTPREKDFVYGNLEPIEVKTVRSFKIPTSYRAKRSHLKDPSCRATTVHKYVDTTNLGVPVEDLPKSEEISSTLLCSLEKELRGHLISESSWTDGLYINVGTQTFNIPSAPFKADVSLADVAASKPHGLYMHVETESVTRRHNKKNSAFSFMCGGFFRRDEYRTHFRNVHSDIQAHLNGWFQQRCPLAYLGCTFTQIRFRPAGQEATIKFCQDVNAFALQPLVPLCHYKAGDSFSPQLSSVQNCDPVSSLPLEVLQKIAGYLDSFTLSQLSQVSHLMRVVCGTLLRDRGMVSLYWQKEKGSHGGTSWRCNKKIWKFSCAFSSVDCWKFSDSTSMSDHLKTCSFYQREQRREPVALTYLREVTGKHGELNKR